MIPEANHVSLWQNRMQVSPVAPERLSRFNIVSVVNVVNL